MHTSFIMPFNTDRASLSSSGGKGLNLTRLYRAGFPVPPGFIVSTSAYAGYVDTNNLEPTINQALQHVSLDAPSLFDTASQAIRAAFAGGEISPDLLDALQTAYADLGSPPVAVRSSATAEDLPGFSFAGQQDTYLNIIDVSALAHAVIDCWSSLWTARAISYRARNAIPHSDAALAVVVQTMVSSEVSGVLFTANPLTGKRDECVIDATFGLGEALVSGLVEPDHYVVDADGGILSQTIGSKGVVIEGKTGGGTATTKPDSSDRATLDGTTLQALANLGQRIASSFDTPQDIEWAIADGQLYVLQSRPITTLFPLPEGLPAEPLRAFFSFGAVQGVLDPITPLGRDLLTGILIGAGTLFGYHNTLETQQLLREAGERLWVNVTGLLSSRLGQKVMQDAMTYVEPAALQVLQSLISQGRFSAKGIGSPRAILSVFKVFVPLMARMFRTFLQPEKEREKIQCMLEDMIAGVETQLAQTTSLREHLDIISRTTDRLFTAVLPRFVSCFGLGMASYTLLTRLSASFSDAGIDTRTMMRGVPHNVTTDMDMALWQTAQAIQSDETANAYFLNNQPDALAAGFKAGQLPDAAQTAVGAFMVRYGMRGLGEIDLGRPRWRDDPTPVMQSLQSYVQITDTDLAPDAVYERGKQAADAEIERLITALRQTRGGWNRARIARLAAQRMRALIGLRETPKFTIIRLFGFMQKVLLADGARLVEMGLLHRAEDVFYLHVRELYALAAVEQRDWMELVQTRRQISLQEQHRRQIPRVLLSTGEAFYNGVGTIEGTGTDHAFIGSPVSPGSVEGIVRVVLDPRSTQLMPGEILVCPGTDPSWTPLFLVAGGLVMEVGGMMTHGAVVAREYGLPAVVGVHDATSRLQTGQRVQVDGSSGRVIILDD